MNHCPDHSYCEILYSSKVCPLCEAESTIGDLEDQIEDAKKEIAMLEKARNERP
jgi:hypothetical protein